MTETRHELDHPCEWAVLFVHGIGHQQPGSTVERYGRPFTEFALAQLPAGASRLERVEEGWQVSFEIGGKLRRWLIVELHWADLVAVPTYRALLRWLVLVAPWVFHSDALLWGTRRHPVQRRRRHWSVSTLRWAAASPLLLPVWSVVRSMILLLLGVIAQLIFVIIGVLGLIPVLRRPVRALQQLLADSVGDSFAYLYGEGTWARIERRLVDAVQSCAGRADRVAVVTHSQGTAVMHRALADRAVPDRVSLWLSLGSGLQKLLMLRQHSIRFLIGQAILRLVAVVLIVLTIPGWARVVDPESGDDEFSSAVGLALLVALALLWIPYRSVRRSHRDLAVQVGAPLNSYALRWVDLFTFHDPVPAGPLPGSSDDFRSQITSIEVQNLGSYLRDHSAYPDNAEQVQATLFGLLIDRTDVIAAPELFEARRLRVGMRRPLLLFGVGAGGALAAPVLHLLPAAAGIGAIAASMLVSHLVIQAAWKSWNDRATADARLGEPRTRFRWSVVITWGLLAGIAAGIATSQGQPDTALPVQAANLGFGVVLIAAVWLGVSWRAIRRSRVGDQQPD